MRVVGIQLVILFLVITAVLCSPVWANNYYVSVSGKDTNPGTIELPFGTIQKAADIMSAGDTCYIRGGIYRENVNLHRSGSEGHVIKFTCYKAEKVVIDGTDILTVGWTVHSGNIYKALTNKNIEQLFVDGDMVVEARWPNIASPDGVFDRNTWLYVDSGSLGELSDTGLGASPVSDWSGGYGAFNLSQQMDTWIRKVETHNGNTLTYDVNGVTTGLNASFDDDRFYLFGKLEALDIPGEVVLDRDSNTLYLWTKDGESPANHELAFKQREYGFDALPDTAYIELNGLHFFGCEFRFQQNCHYITIDDCHLRFNNYFRIIPWMANRSNFYDSMPQMAGDHFTFQNCTIAHCLLNGIYFLGSYVTAKNNLLYDINWNGSNRFLGMVFAQNADANSIYGQGKSLARNNTVYNTGNVNIKFRHRDSLAEYNNLFHGGLSGRDTTLLYTAGDYPHRVFQYNWLHDNHSWFGEGLGLRLDGNLGGAQCESNIIRGNIVWNCAGRSFVIKGLDNRVYNNTVLGEINFKFDSHYKTRAYNNYARSFTFTDGATQSSLEVFSNNSTASNPQFSNTTGLDFMPMLGSSLIDAGTSSVDDYQWDWKGNAPDIGALEYGSIPWAKPGYKAIRASEPEPVDNAKNVDPCNTSLSWTGTETGVKDNVSYGFFQNFNIKVKMAISKAPNFYDIYFGTSLTAVETADRASAEFKGTQSKTKYVSERLQANTTYYWRIDNLDSNQNFLKYGHIWNFRTAGGNNPVVRKFIPKDDTFISQGDPGAKAGNLSNIRVKNYSAQNQFGFIKFEVANVRGNVISAKLRLHTQWQAMNNTEVYPASGQWDEETLTWSNSILAIGSLITSIANLKQYVWYEFDVSSYIKGNGTYTLCLQTSDTRSSNDWFSKEYNNGFFSPELVVTYSD